MKIHRVLVKVILFFELSTMPKVGVRRRTSKLPYGVQPTLLLTNIFFLDPAKPKYILVGYSISNDFRVVIVFCLNKEYIELTLSDWITLTINNEQIIDWYTKNDYNSERRSISTKNILINMAVQLDETYGELKINNHKELRRNSTIYLDFNEYQKCIEIDTFVQNIVKTYQSNRCAIEDYYNIYVHKCNAKNQKILDDIDYFYANNPNFDCYRLFKEISYF